MSSDGFGPLEGSSPASARARRSQAKGAAGEREALAALRDVMANVEQELGVTGSSSNVVRRRLERGRSREDISGIPLISIEVKRNESLNVRSAWDQCVRQADTRLPVLLYRYNREPWRVRTWVALTDQAACILSYVPAEMAYPDFLSYFSKLYRQHLIANEV